MERNEGMLKAGCSRILWAVMMVVVCVAPALRADETVPPGDPWDIDYPVSGNLYIDGTANLLTGASVFDSIYVQDGGTLNMYSGTIGTYSFISVSLGAAGMTVFGTDLAVDTIPVQYGEITLTGGMGTLTGTYEDGSSINLWIFSNIPINLVDTSGPGPGPAEITIDIKPGSYPNAINLGSNGVIPVAILSTPDFLATELDPDTVFLAGSGVAVRGKGNKLLASEEDVNGDGLIDLVVKVETENLDPGTFQDGYAILQVIVEETVIYEGSDEITIVPPE